jgi:hypothetical protein
MKIPTRSVFAISRALAGASALNNINFMTSVHYVYAGRPREQFPFTISFHFPPFSFLSFTERLSLIHHSSCEIMKAPSGCGNFSALCVLREI